MKIRIRKLPETSGILTVVVSVTKTLLCNSESEGISANSPPQIDNSLLL